MKEVRIYVEEDVLIRFVRDKSYAHVVIRTTDKEEEFVSKQMTITEYLEEKGVSKKCCGYNYFKDAIRLAIDVTKKKGTYSLRKDIYPYIMEKYDVSISCVDKGLYNAIRFSDVNNMGTKSFINNYINTN